MNKTAIKNFAIWARKKLMSDIKTRLGFVGITEDGVATPLESSTRDIQYFASAGREPLSITGEDIISRRKLAEQLEQESRIGNYKTAFESLVENTASAWFNRLIAIRFMEVNGYLSDGIRMLSSEESGKQDPDIVSSPFDSDLEFTDAEHEEIVHAKLNNETDRIFRMLFFKRCHQLHKALPGLFEDKGDATEFLMRLSVIDTDGVIYHLVHDISEEDFNVSVGGQVEIIGWLYQYYNTELKDDTFAKLKKNIKITKERIPAATQLFTPDWIVRYMVENSVGRIWIEHLRAIKPETDEKQTAERFSWKYYLPEAEQEPDVAQQLVEIRKSYASLKPEDIKCIDPCMGSGHILVAMFDVLMDIYRSEGYEDREAAFEIVENNLHGLDIDVRAYQLAYFAVMMKGMQYNHRFLSGRRDDDGKRVIVRPKVYAIEESNLIKTSYLAYYGTGMDELSRNNAVNQMTGLLDVMKDAKEYGSILNVDNYDWALLREFVSRTDFEGQMTLDFADAAKSEGLIRRLIDIGEVLASKFDAVVTNPPYMSAGGMSSKLSTYVRDHYSDSRTDLFAVFIEKCRLFSSDFYAMITQHGWMFLSSFEKLRNNYKNQEIVSMLHLGARAFDEISGEVVQTTSFVYRCQSNSSYNGCFVRLVDYSGEEDKDKAAISAIRDKNMNYYESSMGDLGRIPGSPLAYWAGRSIIADFEKSICLSKVCETRKGLATSDNNRFLRLWYEVSFDNIGFDCESNEESKTRNEKWYPINKGGEFKRWYGNRSFVINWKNDGYEIRNFKDDNGKLLSRPQNTQYNYRQALTWSKITSSIFSARFCEGGFLFDDAAAICHHSDKDLLLYVCGFLNSHICQRVLKILNPTLNVQIGDIGNLPVIKPDEYGDVKELVSKSIDLAKSDWNTFETSWGFENHPLVDLSKGLWDATAVGASMHYYYGGHPEVSCPIELCYMLWQGECNERFKKLKENEEELNRIFIEIYGLQDELTPEVEDKDVTVRKADLGRDIRSFLSYAIGCMFGRYSLAKEGLAYAGGEWTGSGYGKFEPDPDNIIPILDTAYFEDDIVKRIEEFLCIVFGEDSLEANLTYIAKALDEKSVDARETIRAYFLNDFFKDHCSTYSVTGSGKRPIYWLFDSGKQNGFKALVYMHRWNPDTEARVRAMYLHKVQEKYENEVKAIDTMISHMTDNRLIAKEEKRKEKLKKQIAEVKEYDEILDHIANEHIDIDLDDGVKVNYEKVQTDHTGKKYNILAPIK
ncbi:MAG: BREX-1 system adenine-specific DNA-methyltransferase PglX [Butyrivibrio sp.]|nr:BREX-1 system adenine-specific DNA-methyltransferase PglX [Butyrivibrio sp.]